METVDLLWGPLKVEEATSSSSILAVLAKLPLFFCVLEISLSISAIFSRIPMAKGGRGLQRDET